MNRFFNIDNKFFVFMGRVADLILLNILRRKLLCNIIHDVPPTDKCFSSIIEKRRAFRNILRAFF